MTRLQKEGYRPILVGGLAIEVAGYGGTKDVGVMVPEAQFGTTDSLAGEGLLIHSMTGGWVTNGHLTLADGTEVPFDILNPAKYVGTGHTGEEFYVWVEKHGSRRTRYGRVAKPSVVYYTRLLVSGPHGEAYLERIRRDLNNDAPRSWLDGSLAIARRFGTEDRVRKQIGRFEMLTQENDLRRE